MLALSRHQDPEGYVTHKEGEQRACARRASARSPTGNGRGGRLLIVVLLVRE